MSPTQRSLNLLRKIGLTCQVVERWQPHSRRRIDLFGFIDIVFLNHRANEVCGLQTTSKTNIAARIAKIKAEPRAKEWLESGGKIWVHGWGKRKLKRGGKAVRWHCTETEITLSDFHPTGA